MHLRVRVDSFSAMSGGSGPRLLARSVNFAQREREREREKHKKLEGGIERERERALW